MDSITSSKNFISHVECTKCPKKSLIIGETAEGFYRRLNGKSPNIKTGWKTVCLDCLKKHRAEYYQKNRRAILDQKKIYSKENEEYLREYRKQHYIKIDGKSRTKEQYHKHKDRISARNKEKRLKKRKTEVDILWLINRRKVAAFDPIDRVLHDKLKFTQHTAPKRNIEFNLTFDYIKSIWDSQKGKCYYSGEALSPEVNNKNVVSIDRINSDLGYVEGNIRLCTKQVNLAKHILSLAEFVDLCRKIVGLHG